MKTKIQIKSIFGKLLFEFEKENNSIKETLKQACLSGAYLSGAYLSGAYLRGAYLRGAYLSGADLSGAYLRGACLRDADLRGADLSGADLSGADLSGAYLSDADLSGADLNGLKIKKMGFFNGIYRYDSAAIIDNNNIEYIKLGCFLRKKEDWEKNFWNNDKEFPNDNSIKSQLRLLAFETCKKWLEINRDEK